MVKFPLLETLRAERQRLEHEITAPLHREYSRRIAEKEHVIRECMKVLSHPLGKMLLEEMSVEIARRMAPEYRRVAQEMAGHVTEKATWEVDVNSIDVAAAKVTRVHASVPSFHLVRDVAEAI